ncbi:outer membrane protein [Frigidibacter oleivorans]|uniref:outer membrane protein n=1 Tax=Frigidibacter oleivorans TaxID=2487129 RepID=UPI000F8D7AEB|nr:outer membrane beta-barrel protein [Frigidibacter oleivorans]
MTGTGRTAVGAAALATAALVAMQPATARAEVEISLYTGFQGAMDSDVSRSGAGSEDISWDGRSFDMPPYYGIRATWWRPDGWGFGAEVNHAKIYAKDAEDHGYETLEFTDGINFVTANVFYRWQDRWAGWTPYVGGGLGISVPHVEVTPVGGSDTFEYQVTGPVVQAVAGVSRPVSEHWAVFAEYKGTWSDHEADLEDDETLKTEIVTHAVNIGVSYRF